MTIFNVSANVVNPEIRNLSKPVKIMRLGWEAQSKTILAFCDDGYIRKCRTERFEDQSIIPLLVNSLRDVRDNQETIQFKSKGNNSANLWFFAIERLNYQEL